MPENQPMMTTTTKANKICENQVNRNLFAMWRIISIRRTNAFEPSIFLVFFGILTAIYFMNGSKIFDVSALSVFFSFVCHSSHSLHIKRCTCMSVFFMSYAPLLFFYSENADTCVYYRLLLSLSHSEIPMHKTANGINTQTQISFRAKMPFVHYTDLL